MKKDCILVIDDDESICRTMQKIFNASGYITKYSLSGQAALELLKNEEFSLAFIDIRLPDIKGTDLIELLAELSPNLPVIMITGHASIETAVSAMSLGASAYITKPLDMDEVLKTVANTIERQALIRDKRKAEEALKEQEVWFRNIFNDSPIAINVFNAEGNFINANDAAVKFAGVLDLHDFEGYNIFDDLNLTDEILSKLQQDERILLNLTIDFKKVKERNLYRTTRFDTAHIELLFSPLKFGAKDIIQGYVVQIIDVTDRKLAEQSVIEERDKAQLYLNTAGVIFVALDRNAKILLLNQYGSEILGITVEEAIGKDWFSNFIPERNREEVRRVFNEVINASESAIIEFDNTVLTTEGFERVIHWNGTSLRDEKGNILGLLSSGNDITKRKQAEDALRESEEKFRRTFNESPIGIEILDSSGCIIDTNPAARRIFGVTDAQQLIGFDVFKDPNTPEHVKELIRQGKTYRFESTFRFDIVKENGLYDSSKVGIMFLDTVVTPLGTKDDQASFGTMIQFQDITNSKLAEKALKESEEKWRSFTQESPDHITIIDSHLIVQFANRPAEGLTFTDLIGKSILEFTSDSQKEDVRKMLSEMMQNGKPVTYYTTYNHPDSSPIYYETRAIPRTIDNKIVGALLSSRDITDRKAAEERIQYQAYLLQNISDAVISENLDFRITSWNKAAEQLYGWKREEAIGKKLEELLQNEYTETARDDVISKLDGTGAWNGQIMQTRKDGVLVHILTGISYLYDSDGNPTGLVSVNRDVTDYISIQRNLQSERDRAMLYLDLMSHDIRNKLQAITIGLEIIETSVKKDELTDLFSEVQDAADQCSQIISKIKRTEKLTEVVLEPRNLSKVVLRSVEDHYADKSDIIIEVNNAADEALVLADQFLEDLITSLLENAVVHNMQIRKEVYVSIVSDSNSVILSIADNGPGMSDERKKFLFDKARRYGGVSLHQVKHIVDKYEGKIVVQDRVTGVQSDGAKFDIWLPLFKGELA